MLTEAAGRPASICRLSPPMAMADSSSADPATAMGRCPASQLARNPR